ncbi:MAG: 50S ribosomal protein L29 [Cyanobacteria bacterium SID2]|nr:50S ribosomal protein L29 [Cyanobacteria bacterium SID2]MBP0003795.1 50S ribosomal protein L29 [Cyanobacteria bacterium SBC]
MSLPKIDEVRNLSDEEIAEEVLKVKKQLFDLRLEQATGQLEKPHQFKHLRHRLAQLLTIEHQRQRAAQGQNSDSPASNESDSPAATVEETPAASEEE